MAVSKLSPREQLAIHSLQEKSDEVRKTAQDTIRTSEEHLLRAEAVVTTSTLLIDRAKATLDALAEKRKQRFHREQNQDDKEAKT